ncbi:MAG: TonB-dependent receptor [Acidobacteria bacterium]|nr:TonB-dependent receptor [Acidobacteriota bacterium]
MTSISLKPIIRVALISLSVLALSLFPVWAQVTGSIVGTTRDQSGAVLPGATITVKNVETGVVRESITNDSGRYVSTNLPLGTYEVKAEVPGFQTKIRSGVALTAGREAVIDFVLEVGEISEVVEIRGDAAQVETTTSTIAGLVDENKVRELPLNARSLIELAPLQAGVVFAEYGTGAASGNVTVGFSKKLSIAGTRQYASLFQLDGTSITDRAGAPGSAAGLLTGVETIKEFQIITNAYSAEYGRHTGGVFNAVTKSGTNEFHGSVFEFLRNDNLDARNFFDGQVPPEFKRNQFGAAAGGPIIKEKSFVFGSYEGLREQLGLTRRFDVLSNNARQGLLPDPKTGELRQVGVANSVKPFLAWFPVPNGRDFGDGRAELIQSVSQDTDEDFVTVRIDHNLSRSDTLFGRYTFDKGLRTVPAQLNVMAAQSTRNQYLTLGETKVFSPNLINLFSFGFNRGNLLTNDEPLPGFTDLRSFTRFTQVGGNPLFGQITVGNVSSIGGRNFVSVYEINNYFQFKDTVTYTRGKHSMKLGVDIERRQDNRTQGTFRRAGVYSFLGVEEFLRGRVDQFSSALTGDAERYYRQTLMGFFFQDDISLFPNFTLNLGIRYEPTGDMTEKYERISTFRFDFKTRVGIKPSDASIGNPFFEDPSAENFAPRIGFAWDPWGDGKTAVRAGFGLFYDLINSTYTSGGDLGVLPLIVVRGSLTANQVPNIDFPNAFFTQFDLLSGAPEVDVIEWEPPQPYVMKWSLDIQRELMPDTVFKIGYVGSRGLHLPMQTMWNVPQFQLVNGRLFAPPTAPFRHPDLRGGRLRAMVLGAASNYHAMLVELNRRFSEALQFQMSYTFSKSIDDSSSLNGGSDYVNDGASLMRYLDFRDTGLSAFDVRHNMVFNFTYDLPGREWPGAAGKLLGGWSLSGIGRFSDGNPMAVSSGVASPHLRFNRDFPDRNPAVPEIRVDSRNPIQYYDPAAFLPQQPGFLGNLGRNVLIAPGIANFDLVVTKNIPASDHFNIQFRAEFFNLFNRANFGLPESTVFDRRTLRASPTAGRIRSTITTSRQIQFGLKLLF